ncbi:hypothetical protein DM02DRAFT_614533 [Periconia macrospinosa]|uniref:Zn(2)-C6 fungal-type domain-containing protein n=1 Tax=Periconia macrospinosa TaxID=97972 RepID=A0A2V1DQQ3_9PLEO|nr:hypothetical protein DM02DRAFT_614533 [Periconia macrospinosa]
MESRPGSTTAAPSQINTYQHPQDGAIFNNGPVQLARGRQARDPQAKTVSYTVASMDEFDSSLKDYLNSQDDPEHTECQLSFWIGAHFLVPLAAKQPTPQHHQHQPSQQQSSIQSSNNGLSQYDASQPYQDVANSSLALSLSSLQPGPASASNASAKSGGDTTDDTNNKNNKGKAEEQPRVTMTIIEALQPTSDPKEKMRKQRAIAKCCVDAIQKADGYRYSFHNCWNSREDDAFRFSYYCNDSLLNKDRAANGKGAKLGKRATKPVFDCKGVLSVKFSASKQTLDVFYKHNPIHKTYEERAPAPRKDSKRRKFLEENDPETLERLQSRSRQTRADSDPQVPPRARKRTKSEDHRQPTSLESDLRAQSLVSLLELIRPEPTQQEPPPPVQIHQNVTPAPRQVQRQHPQSAPQAQSQPQQPQAPPPPAFRIKRPRNSCDVCKAKKTKCDGTRPVCKTCIEKKRQCFYNEADENNASAAGESTRQAQSASAEISELERMKKELEEAKARIQMLEEEKRRASLTPAQTPTTNHSNIIQPPPQTQPQSQPPSDAKPQPAPGPSHRQQHKQQQQQQQQQQQSNQVHQQQQQSQSQKQPQPQQQPQMQVRNSQPSSALQQLQSAAHHMQENQAMPNSQQLQSPQYSHFPTQASNPYGLNRPMSSQNMPQNMPSNAGGPHQSPSQANQMHGAPNNAGLAPAPEAPNPYERSFVWPSNTYYGYQAAQPHQPDQWNTNRNSGVFR